jgi:hypothetical protein
MVSPTNLPVLHWHVKNPQAANTDSGTIASVYFNGDYYDQVLVHRRGAGRREHQQNRY